MTGMINANVICVRQGDSFTFNIEVRDMCKAVNLTGAELVMQARDENNQLMWTLNGVDVDVANGKMAILLTPLHTNMQVGDYSTDIQLKTADGSVHTLWPADVNQIGTLRITPQVTVTPV